MRKLATILLLLATSAIAVHSKEYEFKDFAVDFPAQPKVKVEIIPFVGISCRMTTYRVIYEHLHLNVVRFEYERDSTSSMCRR